MIVVSSPYGDNTLVSDSIKEIGFEQRTPRLAKDEYRKTVKQALIDLIERHKKNKHPIVVMDDGGLVADIVHSDLAKDPKYAAYVDQIRIVEQTKNGLLLADRNELLTLLVTVCISEIKKLEGDAIGEVVGTHVGRRLTHRAGGVKGKKVVVFGHGIIGAPTARVLAAQGAKVTVVETGPDAADEAGKLYPSHHIDAKLFERDSPEGSKELMALKKALSSADYVVGASGTTSMKLWMFDAMKDGATWANISSKRHEGEIEKLERKAEKEILEQPNPLQTLPDAAYTFGGKTIFVDGDGWPFTLNGTVQHVPPERIQFTDAAMVGGLFQICKAYRRRGLEKLAFDIDDLLSKRLIARRPTFASLPIYDANAWRDTIREISRRF
jgi:S-adenosylhomocysteine hydrolase